MFGLSVYSQLKKDNSMNPTATPARQFPLRLESSLADRLDQYSLETRIPKTTISRIAIEKFLNELDETGIRTALRETCTV